MSRPGDHPDPAVRVRVPATSANLGPGFDTLGLALALHDEIEVAVTGGGLDVQVQGEGAGVLSRGEGNLVVRAARAAFERLGTTPPGLAVRCTNRIPHGRGMGSSAAAIVAGVSAARALAVDMGRELTEAQAFALAAELEGHPDNVAACLAGGLAVAWGEGVQRRWVRLDPEASLAPVALVPGQELDTGEARGLLPQHVAHGDAALNAGRAALLIAGLTTHPEMLFDATEDRLHQDYRAVAMPGTAALLARLRAAGAPAVVSGAGPSILVLAQAQVAGSIGAGAGADWRVFRLDVDREGVRVDPAAR